MRNVIVNCARDGLVICISKDIINQRYNGTFVDQSCMHMDMKFEISSHEVKKGASDSIS